MKIAKKLMNSGKISKVVVLPKTWLEYVEQKEGSRVSAISMEIADSLVLNPIFEKQSEDGVYSRQAEHTTQLSIQEETTVND